MTAIEQAFANLAEWRPLPGYSVERRLDLLLTPFIPSFLASEMNAPVSLVTAEFPIPKRVAGGRSHDRRHVSADFLCLRGGESPAWLLVELKTDVGSRRGVQDQAYRTVAGRKKAMPVLLDALLKAKRGTEYEAEYQKVYWKVKRAGSRVERIEICYLEPGGEDRSGRPEGEPRVWSFGLGALATSIRVDGDPFARLVQKTLRGLARSDKARGVRAR